MRRPWQRVAAFARRCRDAERLNMTAEAAIEMVVDTNDRPLVHPDRGAHIRWRRRLSRTVNASLTRSTSRKGAAASARGGSLSREL